ncbi:hypothetical protein [Chelativorans alearense]|uniref:hypothetical protein n=1 Tax=Chelativorans alearense TaxID=2681495 RepID=UPI0013D8D71F|nr:hypothetical protein [Chelativorans alearense]
MAITPEGMLELAANELDCANLDLRPTNRIIDHTAPKYAKLIKAELAQPNLANELYLDSLITILGIHALRHYSNAADAKSGGLSTATAARVRD